MKDSFKSKIFSKKTIIIAAIALLLIIGAAIIFKNGNGAQKISVVRANIIQEVAVAGKVKPNQSVNLGFDKSGKIASVYFDVGGNVEAGQVIASLENGETSADLAKAQAALSEAEANLRDIQITAPTSYGDAYKNLDAAIRSSFTSADDAVRNKTDQFFSNVKTNPQFGISFTDGNFIHYFNVPDELKIEINGGRKSVEKILNDWEERISKNISDPMSEANTAISDLNAISDLLDKVAEAVNSFTSSDYNYDSTVSGYKTATASARSEVATAISSLITAKDKMNSAGAVSSGQLDSVTAEQAKVKQAEASVISLRAALSKTVIKAPFSGVVTVQDAKIGQAVSAGEPLVSMISQDAMYIEANVSEINIGKISEGNPVSIIFDAFPSEEFSGKVSYIEPGDVLVDGVVNYKIRISFDNFDPKIKSGLTANLKVKTAEKSSALVIPLYAVTEENGQSFVNKFTNEMKTEKIPVKLGLVGNDGMVEVLSGLSEGNVVSF